NSIGKRCSMEFHRQKRELLNLQSWLQLSIENSPRVSAFLQGHVRLRSDFAAGAIKMPSMPPGLWAAGLVGRRVCGPLGLGAAGLVGRWACGRRRSGVRSL